jgi:hypothetical protein
MSENNVEIRRKKNPTIIPDAQTQSQSQSQYLDVNAHV